MGNTLTRPSANTAIDYEEDKSIKAPPPSSAGSCPCSGMSTASPPSMSTTNMEKKASNNSESTNTVERRASNGANNAAVSGLLRQKSGLSRLRLFSTFQSAARPSITSDDESHNRIKLSEILESGVPIATEPGEFSPDQIFLRRLAHYEFRLFKPVTRMRMLFCKNLDEAVYAQQQLGETITNAIRMRPNLRVIHVGDLEPSSMSTSSLSSSAASNNNKGDNIIKLNREVYIPERTTGSKRLFLFIVGGEEDCLLVKAKAVIMDERDKENMEYIAAHMRERDEKVEKLARRAQALQGTLLGLYDAGQLATLHEKNQAVPKPPVRYLIGVREVLIGFHTFEPANRDAIAANLIICGTENSFMPYVAHHLSTLHPIRVIIMDLRGFGYSGGRRGHTPQVNTLFQDLRQMVRHIKGLSRKPIILGGHYFGAGVIINYDSYRKKEPVDGYLLLSPILGLDWSFAWRPQLKNLRKSGGIVDRRMMYLLNKWTCGRLAGSQYVVNIRANEETYEFAPLHFSRMTANFVRAYQVSPQQLKSLSAPTAIFLAGQDEFFDSHCLKKRLDPLLKNHTNSKVILCEGQTGIQMNMEMSGDVANWITSLPVVIPWLAQAQRPHQPIITPTDLATVKAFLPSSIYDAVEAAMARHIYDRKPRETDCPKNNNLTFDYWEPSYLPGRPLGVLVMLAPRCQANWMPTLAEQFRFIIVRLDPWISLANQQKKNNNHHRKVSVRSKCMWRFIGYAIRAVRANHPAAPLFVGGISYGASLAMGYVQYEAKTKAKGISVNGVVLISPALHANSESSPANNPYLAPGVGKIADPSTILFNEATPIIGAAPDSTSDLLVQIGYVPHLVREHTRDFFLSRDLVGDVRALDMPTAIVLPSAHPYINGVRLFEELESFLRAPFKTAALLSGDLYSTFDDAASILGTWLVQLASSVAPRAPLLLRDPHLEDFEPIEMIGKGTFGKVWLVRHPTSQRFLALKVLDKETIVRSKQVTQVLRERAVLAECASCPFIVNFVGSFQDTARLFLAMEFVIGGELFTRLNAVGKLRVEDVRFYAAEVIIALQYLHQRGIVYRDLKPENIVLDALGHIRLVDFGFARHLNERGRASSFCGSPYYIAPEMLSNAQYGTSVDIWALGVLLFELLTGGPPFSGKTANEVYRRILFSPPEIPVFLDSDTRDLLQSLLQQSPEGRLGGLNNKNGDGIDAVMRHRWFKGIDWERVKAKQLPPPYQPHFSFEGDTNNFMKFAGMTLESVPDSEEKFNAMFKDYNS